MLEIYDYFRNGNKIQCLTDKAQYEENLKRQQLENEKQFVNMENYIIRLLKQGLRKEVAMYIYGKKIAKNIQDKMTIVQKVQKVNAKKCKNRSKEDMEKALIVNNMKW